MFIGVFGGSWRWRNDRTFPPSPQPATVNPNPRTPAIKSIFFFSRPFIKILRSFLHAGQKPYPAPHFYTMAEKNAFPEALCSIASAKASTVVLQ